MEMFGTFVFVMSVIIVKDAQVGQTVHGGNPWLACAVIAVTLTAMVLVLANHTGGCLNPAVGIAQHILINDILEENNADGFWKVYMMGPLLGGLIAGAVSLGHRHFINRYAGERQPTDTYKPSKKESTESSESD